jgi:lysophospholipase L1-like esterase
LTPYAQVVCRLAAENHVPLVDLHALSIKMHESLGPEDNEKFDMNYKDPQHNTKPDKTHLSSEGAKTIGRMVADEVMKVEPALVPYFQ